MGHRPQAIIADFAPFQPTTDAPAWARGKRARGPCIRLLTPAVSPRRQGTTIARTIGRPRKDHFVGAVFWVGAMPTRAKPHDQQP